MGSGTNPMQPPGRPGEFLNPNSVPLLGRGLPVLFPELSCLCYAQSLPCRLQGHRGQAVRLSLQPAAAEPTWLPWGEQEVLGSSHPPGAGSTNSWQKLAFKDPEPSVHRWDTSDPGSQSSLWGGRGNLQLPQVVTDFLLNPVTSLLS